MIRRLFTVASALSLLLCIGTTVLWVRSRSTFDVWEVRTLGRQNWSFSSTPYAWKLWHVAHWPEPPGVSHVSYADVADLKEHGLAVERDGIPGTYVRTSEFAGMSIQYGRLSTIVGHDGVVIRVPPSPPGDLTQYASAPMPYWGMSFPRWLMPVAFLLLPCGVLLLRGRRLVLSRLRRGQLRCGCCGYDLRASRGRCPECGRVVPQGLAELTRAEKAVLKYLRKDAAKCGKIYHFDPAWVARKTRLDEPEFRAAARRLRSIGLVSIHEFEWNGDTRLTDVALIDDSIPPAYPYLDPRPRD